jgi:uroporphyrinogen decarboxylase
MPQETMTPRERWRAVFRRELPDRVPMDYWGTSEAGALLMRHLGCADMDQVHQRLHIDAPVSVGPSYAGPPVPEDQDMYGCRYRTVDYGTGAYRESVFHPLAQYGSVEEIEAHYAWPTADWFDYSAIPAQVEGKDHRPVRGGGSEPFLTYKELRGQEQAFMDLALAPDVVHYCLDRLFEFCYQNTLRIYEQLPGRVDITYVAEDLGSQEGLMISRAHIRRFLLPRMKRMMDLVHEAGAFVFFHSDGAVLDILPDMVEAGIDVLNPIQWRCRGMDRQVLKDRFGARIALHGGVDNQQTLPFGSAEDVREEVAYNLRVLGAGGGYVLGPCHNIQAVSPPENVVAMYESGYELGWY